MYVCRCARFVNEKGASRGANQETRYAFLRQERKKLFPPQPYRKSKRRLSADGVACVTAEAAGHWLDCALLADPGQTHLMRKPC